MNQWAEATSKIIVGHKSGKSMTVKPHPGGGIIGRRSGIMQVESTKEILDECGKDLYVELSDDGITWSRSAAKMGRGSDFVTFIGEDLCDARYRRLTIRDQTWYYANSRAELEALGVEGTGTYGDD